MNDVHVSMVRIDGHYVCSCGFEPPQQAPGTPEGRSAVQQHIEIKQGP
jgi:hypothetical protein